MADTKKYTTIRIEEDLADRLRRVQAARVVADGKRIPMTALIAEFTEAKLAKAEADHGLVKA